MQKTQNKITAEELGQHLDEYLDKVEDGENVTVEYDGQLYAIVKGRRKSCSEFQNSSTEKNDKPK